MMNIVLDEAGVRRTMARIAHQIIDRNGGAENIALVGVVAKGDILAKRLGEQINAAEGCETPVGSLDITFYRDDIGLGFKRLPKPTNIPFSIKDKTVVLVDDVLFTGRTARAALDALMDFGRPRAVQFAVLVDRGHRELPIQPDYTGQLIETRPQERVQVLLKEEHGEDGVVMIDAGKEG